MQGIHTMRELEKFRASQNLVLLYLSGNNCGLCQAVRPKILEILQDHPEVLALELNTHEDRELAAQLSVFTIPAILVYAGGREAIREARYFSLVELRRRIERLSSCSSEPGSH